MKEIIKYPNPLLETKCEQVTLPLSKEDEKILDELYETLKNTPNSVGLAAPQIGVTKRMFVIRKVIDGKVVARFWCDNVTEYINGGQWHSDDTFGSYDDYIKDNILKQSCLTEEELFAYCEDLAFSAINITQLEIFDEPIELDSFIRKDKDGFAHTIKRPPQSWCYIHGQVIGGNPL